MNQECAWVSQQSNFVIKMASMTILKFLRQYEHLENKIIFSSTFLAYCFLDLKLPYSQANTHYTLHMKYSTELFLYIHTLKPHWTIPTLLFSHMYRLFLFSAIISPIWHSTTHTVQNSWSQVNTKTKIKTEYHNLWIISIKTITTNV